MSKVYIIEVEGGLVRNLIAFEDSREGNSEAERVFSQMITELDGREVGLEEEIAEALENGYWNTGNGADEWTINLYHDF